MSAKSPSEVYLALSKPNGYYWGWLKFNDLSIDNSIKYFKLRYTSFIKTTAVAPH